MASPTKESIIGTFSNNGREQNDFLQLKNQSGGNIFGWIDYQGHLQGSLLQGVIPGGSNTDIQFNNNGVLGGSSAFTFNSTTSTINLGVPASSLSSLLRSYQAGSTQFFEQDIISTVATNPSGFINSLYILQQQDQVLAVNIYQDATTQDHPSGVFPLTVVPLITTSFLPASTFVTGVFSAPRFVGHLDCGTIAGYQSSLEDNTVPCTGNISVLYGYHCEFFTAATVQTAICFNADEINGNLNQGAAFNAVLYGGAVTDDGHSYGVYIKSGANYFGAGGTTKAVQLVNPKAATSLVNQSSPLLSWSGTYWNGSASAPFTFCAQGVPAAGTNPAINLTFTAPTGDSTMGVDFSAVSGGVVVSKLFVNGGGGTQLLQTGATTGGAWQFPGASPANNNMFIGVTNGNPVGLTYRNAPWSINPVDLTAQNAAISTTTLANPASALGAGQYRVTWDAKVTAAAGVSSTLGPLTLSWTDPDGVAQTLTCAAQNSSGTIETSDTGNTTTTKLLGLPVLINSNGATNSITYAFGYASSAANAMNYNLHIRVEAVQ